MGSERLTIRLGDDLNDRLELYCEKHKIKKRSVVVRSAIEQFLANNDFTEAAMLRQELFKFRNDFSRVGGNLNQLAHLFNVHGGVQLSDLEQSHSDLRGEFSEIMKTLSKILGLFKGE